MSGHPGKAAAGGEGGTAGQADLRRHMDELVARVPRHAIRAVIEEIDSADSANAERVRHMREALVDQFNRLRPMKARRLFTSLFEPFLVDDAILYRARDPVPGLIQRVDMGGVWQALARFGFPTLAMEVQDRLDALSQGAILDRVLTGPEAMAMREAMRAEAARFLAQLPGNRKAAEAFLLLANREALRDARQRTPLLAAKAPIDLRALSFIQAVLEDNDTLLPLAERMRRDSAAAPAATPAASAPAGEAHHAEVEGLAAMLVGFGRELRRACPARDADDPVLWLPPLFALNVKHRYDVALRTLREHGAPAPDDAPPLHQALFGHFSACCITIVAAVRGLFGNPEVRDGQALPALRPVRDLLEGAVARLDQSLAALSGAGFLSHRLIGPRIRPALADVSQALTALVLPVAAGRAQAAAAARNAPSPDHEDLVWLLALVWRWGAILRAAGYANPELQALRARLLEDGHVAFLQAVRTGEGEDPARRMEHLARIDRVLGTIGESVGPWISPVSQGLHRIVEHHLEALEDGATLAPEARFVVERFIDSVRRELDRSRHWRSADLVSILRLYEERCGCRAAP